MAKSVGPARQRDKTAGRRRAGRLESGAGAAGTPPWALAKRAQTSTEEHAHRTVLELDQVSCRLNCEDLRDRFLKSSLGSIKQSYLVHVRATVLNLKQRLQITSPPCLTRRVANQLINTFLLVHTKHLLKRADPKTASALMFSSSVKTEATNRV